ncbi:MAG: pilus assembly protein [Planctomycetales bacterium]|nr:pilus assembly protein [Planctomycetales bacterium]
MVRHTSLYSTPRRTRPNWIRRRARRGAIYFAELILVLPVMMIFLLAVVQFGILFGNLQHLSFASRVGAEAASESALPAAAVPPSVEEAIEQHLAANGISACLVRLEHTVDVPMGDPAIVLESGACTCPATTFIEPDGEYTRVSVCAHLTELMPNLLATFGYDISDPASVISASTLMQYEP